MKFVKNSRYDMPYDFNDDMARVKNQSFYLLDNHKK